MTYQTGTLANGARWSDFNDAKFWDKHNSERSQSRIGMAEKAGQPWCAVCGATLNPERAQEVHIIAGGSAVLHPDDEAIYDESDGGDMGVWSVGPECARLFPAAYRAPYSGAVPATEPAADADVSPVEEPVDDIALSIDCPRCGTPAGQRCPTGYGNHDSRRAAAEQALAGAIATLTEPAPATSETEEPAEEPAAVPTPNGRTWRRLDIGYLSPDGRAFLERGAPMEGGKTDAWLIWFRVDDADVIVDGTYASVRSDHRDGELRYQEARRLSWILAMHPDPAAGPWYVHRNDAGSFAEAKHTVALVLAEWANL